MKSIKPNYKMPIKWHFIFLFSLTLEPKPTQSLYSFLAIIPPILPIIIIFPISNIIAFMAKNYYKLIMMGLDIHRQAIFAIESGKRTVSDYELCLIAEVLGIPTNELLKNFIDQI